MIRRMMTGMVMAALMALACFSVEAQQPLARLTEGTISIAPGTTNGSSTAWLEIGGGSEVITPTGRRRLGVGVLRAVMYVSTGGITNGTIAFSAYDGGVKRTVYSASALPSAGSARYDLHPTNLVYSGRLMVEVTQKAYTNAACTWAWTAITE